MKEVKGNEIRLLLKKLKGVMGCFHPFPVFFLKGRSYKKKGRVIVENGKDGIVRR